MEDAAKTTEVKPQSIMKNLYDHPIFTENSKAEVKEKYKTGQYSDDDLKLYIAGRSLKNDGFYNMKGKHVKTLLKGGYISEDMAVQFRDYHKDSLKPKSFSGTYMLHQLANGRSLEDVQKDMGGVEHLWYDPIDLGVDIATGGLSFGARQAGKWGLKGIKAAATKAGAKEMALSAGMGMVAGTGMTVADKIMGNTVFTMLAGLITPMGVHTLATMGRQSFRALISNMRLKNPKLATTIEDTILHSDDKMFAHLKAELDEADIGTTKFDPFSEGMSKGEKKIVQPEGSQGVENPSKGMEFSGKTQGQKIGTTELTKEDAIKIIQKTRDGSGEGEVLDQLAKGNGAKLAAAMSELNAEGIEKARGGVVPRKVSEAEAKKFIQDNYTSIAERSGKRVLDVEKALGDAKALQSDFQNISAKVTGFNDMWSTTKAALQKELQRNDLTFAEEVKLTNQVLGMAEFDEAMYGIRAEFGRGLGLYNRQFREMNYDLSNLPRHEFKIVEGSTRPQVQRFLKAARKAAEKGDTALLNVAKNADKYKYLQGALEWEQGAMLWHWGTQAVNIAGNGAAWGIENISKYAGVSYEAWKIADGFKKPFTRDKKAMQEFTYHWLGQKSAFDTLFLNTKKLPKVIHEGFKKGFQGKSFAGYITELDDSITKFTKEMNEAEIGTFWKALFTGEAQIDPFVKLEGQYGKSFEKMWKIRIPSSNGDKVIKILPDTLTRPLGAILRMPFKGLTAGDELFKTIATHQHYGAELFREAAKDAPEDIGKYIGTRIKNAKALDPMMIRSAQKGRQQTFTESLGESAQHMEKWLGSGRAGLVAKITAMPFFKILINLNKFSAKLTPIGALSKKVQHLWTTGTPADRGQIMAKMMMGTMALAGGFTLYEHKKITGRVPRDQYAAWKNAKKQGYSWITDNEDGSTDFTDYGRFDPVSSLVGIGADLGLAYDMAKEYNLGDKTTDELDQAFDDIVAAVGLAFVEPFINKTFAKSANEIVTSLNDPESTNWSKFAEKQTRKFYPRFIDIANQATGRDDIMREVRDPIDGFWMRIKPDKLQKKRHSVYGTVEERDPRTLGVLNKKISNDKVMDELMRLGMNIRPMPEKYSEFGESKNLEPKQYDKLCSYLTEFGTKELLEEIINDPVYQGIEDAETKRTLYIQPIIAQSRAYAKAMFAMSEYGIPVTKELIQQLELTEAAIMGKLKRPHRRGRFYKFLDRE